MRLLSDRRGMSTVEFAVAAPAVMLFATVAVAALFLHAGSVSLDMGAAAAARAVSVGALDGGEERIDAVRRIVTDHVCPDDGNFCHWSRGWSSESDDGETGPLRIRTMAYVDPRNLGRPEPFVDLDPFNGVYDAGEVYTDVNANGAWDADMGASSLGGSGDYVIFEISMGAGRAPSAADAGAGRARHPLCAARRAQRAVLNPCARWPSC